MSIESRLNKIEQHVSGGATMNPEEMRTRLWDKLACLTRDDRPEIAKAQIQFIERIIDDATGNQWLGIKAISPEAYFEGVMSNIVRRLRRLARAVPGLWPQLLTERSETI
jgi:hypothetical protein